jgi:hypothetical protein
MSQADVEIVRRLFEYGAEDVVPRAGDLTADHPFLSLWHPECVLEEPVWTRSSASTRCSASETA